MDPELRHLERILRGRRAPTQRAVLLSLIGGDSTPGEIAGELGLSRNAVAIALHELAGHGAVDRVGRGRYRARENLVLLAFLNRVERLERRHRRGRDGGHI